MLKYLPVGILLLWSHLGFALPIGFGFNQRDIKYECLESEHLRVYFDSRVPHEGRMIANAIEAELPYLEEWLDIKRSRKLPVISSAVTANASFSNFVTDAIELQTMGIGDRDLYWHETVHAMTYQHFHNIFGPAGSILHLAWLPAWFLEGLAESVSVSVGSDTQAATERYHALSGDWPSYDRLHSLYRSSTFFMEGYATAGAFVRWILKQKSENFLPELLQDFYDYTFPQFWLQTLYPLRSYMPFDRALRKHIGLSGEEAYEKYKKEATEYWQSHRKGNFFAASPAAKIRFSSLYYLHSDGKDIWTLFADGLRRRKNILMFDAQSGFATGYKPQRETYPRTISPYDFPGEDAKLGIYARQRENDLATESRIELLNGAPNFTIAHTLETMTKEIDFFDVARDHFMWHERDFETSQLCRRSRSFSANEKKDCFLTKALADSISVIGAKHHPNNGNLLMAWIAVKTQYLQGDAYELFTYDALAKSLRPFAYDGGGAPLAMITAGADTWLLVGEFNRRALKKIDASGHCKAELATDDFITRIFGFDDGSLALGINAGQSFSVKKIVPANEKLKACSKSQLPKGPLQWVMQHAGQNLTAGLKATDLWAESYPEGKIDNPNRLSEEKAVTKLTSPAPSNYRPVLAFPWIGADDALGPQFGIVSVPLMDEMQNESLRASFLYGPYSHYPNTELTLESTRYAPTLSFSLYRRQLWNGLAYYPNSRRAAYSFLDELGIRANAFWAKRLGNNADAGLSLSIRTGEIKNFHGPKTSAVIEGVLVEPAIGTSFRYFWPRITSETSASYRWASPGLSPKFSYYKLDLGTNLSFRPRLIEGSSISSGIEYAETRGEKKKTPNLRESYQALKTFVPGSGGGYNMNSFNLAGDGSLFALYFGDTYLRSKINGTMPLIRSLEKQAWLFYFDSLNFAMFYNYGGVYWDKIQNLHDHLVSAHGESISVLFENKGVGFNASIGTGQVVGGNWQLYATFGFDALF